MGGSGINYGAFTLVHVFRYLKTIIFAILNGCLVRLSHQRRSRSPSSRDDTNISVAAKDSLAGL